MGAGFTTEGAALAEADDAADALALASALAVVVAVALAVAVVVAVAPAVALALVFALALPAGFADPSLVAFSPPHASSDSVAPINAAAPSGVRVSEQNGQRVSWTRTWRPQRAQGSRLMPRGYTGFGQSAGSLAARVSR